MNLIRGNPGFFSYAIEVAKGNVPHKKIIHGFGQNQVIGASVVDIWITSGIYVWLQAAVTLEAISDDTDDDDGGDGARVITIDGLNADWDEITEDITMNGTSATASTTQTFIRINHAEVKTCGIYSGTNIGNITVRTSGAGATHCILDVENLIGTGHSQLGRYSVPRNKTAFMDNIHVWTDNNKPSTVYMFKRENANVVVAPFTARRLELEVAGLTQPEDIDILYPRVYPQYTDIYFQVIAGTGNTDVAIDFEMVLIDDFHTENE